MIVQALWFGGSNYALPEVEDVERFSSLAAACQAFRARTHDPYYPCVCVGSTQMQIFIGTDNPLTYPDYILTIGPRGGVRKERC